MTRANQQKDANFAVLPVLVSPRASRSEITGWQAERLKLRLKAPPVDGEANAELLRTLSKQLGVPRSALTLQQGEASRRKNVRVAGLSQAELLERLPPVD